MGVKVLIADDEPLARERLMVLLRAIVPDADVREASDGDQAVELVRDWVPEALFLDVQMPGLDGFEVLRQLGPMTMPPTVFVTAFDEYAVRAFEVAAADYLLKPFDAARFQSAWDRLVERRALRAVVQETERFTQLLKQIRGGAVPTSSPQGDAAPPRRYSDRVMIKKEGRSFMVRLADVQWIESAGNYVLIHAGKERHQLRETLTNLEARLDPDVFVRIHRRLIVAVDAMRELQPWFGGDQVMILKDGTKLRVSRNFREHVAARLSGVM